MKCVSHEPFKLNDKQYISQITIRPIFVKWITSTSAVVGIRNHGIIHEAAPTTRPSASAPHLPIHTVPSFFTSQYAMLFDLFQRFVAQIANQYVS